ncbi:hypothetical protein C8R43DRAFT_955228 [Mycena crocata]|nr:hypothetical protein C8R43DRAFT_955228 [Mycena crocata]
MLQHIQNFLEIPSWSDVEQNRRCTQAAGAIGLITYPFQLFDLVLSMENETSQVSEILKRPHLTLEQNCLSQHYGKLLEWPNILSKAQSDLTAAQNLEKTLAASAKVRKDLPPSLQELLDYANAGVSQYHATHLNLEYASWSLAWMMEGHLQPPTSAEIRGIIISRARLRGVEMTEEHEALIPSVDARVQNEPMRLSLATTLLVLVQNVNISRQNVPIVSTATLWRAFGYIKAPTLNHVERTIFEGLKSMVQHGSHSSEVLQRILVDERIGAALTLASNTSERKRFALEFISDSDPLAQPSQTTLGKRRVESRKTTNLVQFSKPSVSNKKTNGKKVPARKAPATVATVASRSKKRRVSPEASSDGDEETSYGNDTVTRKKAGRKEEVANLKEKNKKDSSRSQMATTFLEIPLYATPYPTDLQVHKHTGSTLCHHFPCTEVVAQAVHELDLFRLLNSSFVNSFVDEKPPYCHPNDQSSQSSQKQSSSLFIAPDKSFPGENYKSIFSNRHIFEGFSSCVVGDIQYLGMDIFDLMGIPRETVLMVEDTEKFYRDETIQSLVTQAQDNASAFISIQSPVELALPPPPNLRYLDTSEMAASHCKGRYGYTFYDIPTDLRKWFRVATRNTRSRFEISYMATVLVVERGKMLICIGTPSDSTLWDESQTELEIAQKHRWELILLPVSSRSTSPGSSFIHNHLPDFKLWPDLLGMISLGNLVILSGALDCRTYTNIAGLTIPQQERTEWCSCIEHVLQFKDWVTERYDIIGSGQETLLSIFNQTLIGTANMLIAHNQQIPRNLRHRLLCSAQVFTAAINQTLQKYGVDQQPNSAIQDTLKDQGSFIPLRNSSFVVLQKIHYLHPP